MKNDGCHLAMPAPKKDETENAMSMWRNVLFPHNVRKTVPSDGWADSGACVEGGNPSWPGSPAIGTERMRRRGSLRVKHATNARPSHGNHKMTSVRRQP